LREHQAPISSSTHSLKIKNTLFQTILSHKLYKDNLTQIPSSKNFHNLIESLKTSNLRNSSPDSPTLIQRTLSDVSESVIPQLISDINLQKPISSPSSSSSSFSLKSSVKSIPSSSLYTNLRNGNRLKCQYKNNKRTNLITISASFHNVSHSILIDSGASISIICPTILNSLPPESI